MRRLGRVTAAGMLVAGLLVVGAGSAGADVGDGQSTAPNKINNFDAVYEQDITYALDLQVPGISDGVLAGVDLADDAAIRAALAAVGVDPGSIGIVRSDVLDGTTVATQSTTTVVTSPDAVVIGDLENDPCGVIVVEGSVDVITDTTETTTDFITSTVTVTGALAATPPSAPPETPPDVTGDNVGGGTAAPPAQPVTATPTFTG